jgi:hypothetical protein
MSFVFMVFHWPEPDQAAALAEGMRAMRDAMLAIPGCVGVDPPYLTDEAEPCLVGISYWASEQAFNDADLPLGNPDQLFPGETRPRRRYLLREAPPQASVDHPGALTREARERH